MKKMYSFICCLWLTATLVSCGYFHEVKPAYSERVKKEVSKEIAAFRQSEEEKNAETHRALYLSDQSALNLVLKQYGNPFIVSLPRDQWIGFFTSWDYAYYPVYTNQVFYVGNGMTINHHPFQGYKNEKPDIYGEDLFTYVQTANGWKLVNVTATIVNPDDTTNYKSKVWVSQNPAQVLVDVEKGVTTANWKLFSAAFLQEGVPCFQFTDVFTEPYETGKHSAKSFFDLLTSGNREMNLRHTKVTIHDQLTAHASADYVIHVQGKVETKGEMLATLAATPNAGWKITSMMYSAQ